MVQGDSEKIVWVLNQLLDNAVKFTPSGGRVVVSLKEESSNLVMVSVTRYRHRHSGQSPAGDL